MSDIFKMIVLNQTIKHEIERLKADTEAIRRLNEELKAELAKTSNTLYFSDFERQTGHNL